MNTHLKFVLGAVLLVGGVYWLGQNGGGSSSSTSGAASSNVVVENGAQVVTITAKGGYVPTVSTVQAGIPTTLRFDTAGTYDCSAAVRIPSLGISKSLPANGSTDIVIGVLNAGDSVRGTCGMGMYHFELDVQG